MWQRLARSRPRNEGPFIRDICLVHIIGVQASRAGVQSAGQDGRSAGEECDVSAWCRRTPGRRWSVRTPRTKKMCAGSCAECTRGISFSAPRKVFWWSEVSRDTARVWWAWTDLCRIALVSPGRSTVRRNCVATALTMQSRTVMIRGCHGNVKAHKYRAV